MTITHAYGETTIPAAPTRIVAIGFNDADFVLPSGSSRSGCATSSACTTRPGRPWAQQALAGARPEVVGANEINMEKVASLRPDLIIGVYPFMEESTYRTHSRARPDHRPAHGGDAAAPWQEQTRITGKALGRPAQAEEVVAATEKDFADARAAHPQLAGKDVAVDLLVEGVPYRLGSDDLRGQVFQGLGVDLPATTETLSNETLSQLDTDAIVVVGATKEELAGDPVFQGLAAVKAGKVSTPVASTPSSRARSASAAPEPARGDRRRRPAARVRAAVLT